LSIIVLINKTILASNSNLNIIENSYQLLDANVNFWLGYTYVAMDDINKQLDIKANYMFNNSGGVQPTITKLSAGTIFGFDVLYKVSEKLFLGPRIAFLSFSGEVYGKTTVWGYTDIGYDPVYRAKIIINTFFMPIMFGGEYKKEIKKNLFLLWELFAGVGKTTVSSRFEWYKEFGYQESTYVNLLGEGTGFVLDCGSGGEYRLNKNFSLGIVLFYRFAKISEINQVRPESVLYIGKTKDIVVSFTDFQGNKIPFDFSGLTFVLGITYKF